MGLIGRGMRARRGCEVPGDNAGRVGHGAGMRWVLLLLVALAAVMGGEAWGVVEMGRAVVTERIGKVVVERELEALRGASRGAFEDAGEAAGLVDGGPLANLFPVGSEVARSDCGAGRGGAKNSPGKTDML